MRREEAKRGGANCPLYGGLGYLPVGQGIPGCGQMTVGVESIQNAGSLGDCLRD